MAQAIFLVGYSETIGLPEYPTDETHGFSIDGDGVDGHGWLVCTYVPGIPTCELLVSTTQVVIDAMDTHDDFEWLEDIA